MKIGVITSAYPEFKDDPHGIFVHRLMKEVIKQGNEVHVIAPHTGGLTKYNLDGVEVEKFHYFYPKRFEKLCGRSGMIDNVKEGFLVKFQVLTFLFFNILYSTTKMKDMDIIHVQWPIPNGLGAYFLKKIYKTPYINTVHGEEFYLSKRYNTLFALKWLINNSFKTITNSTATKDSYSRLDLNEDKFQVIPFGVDINFFKPLNTPKNEEVFQILSVGYLIERKGFKYLIKAVKKVLKEYNNVTLKIIGSGPLKNKLQYLITELKLVNQVKLIGNVSDNELLHLYNSSDLFILPSITDTQGNTEGLGVVLLEAMACELPVIGSKVGGIPDIIIDNETGLLVNEKDILELSMKIKYLIDNKELRQKLATNGLNRVNKKFSWNQVMNSYLNIYKKTLLTKKN
ncbi:MAG: glycosyltransferase family 4 protein [Methanobacterium sp.]|jgi:glycosyltransferase involved in cell wall biosynthesis